jgi:hypothetical protein
LIRWISGCDILYGVSYWISRRCDFKVHLPSGDTLLTAENLKLISRTVYRPIFYVAMRRVQLSYGFSTELALYSVTPEKLPLSSVTICTVGWNWYPPPPHYRPAKVTWHRMFNKRKAVHTTKHAALRDSMCTCSAQDLDDTSVKRQEVFNISSSHFVSKFQLICCVYYQSDCRATLYIHTDSRPSVVCTATS